MNKQPIRTLWLGDESWSAEVTDEGAQFVLHNRTTSTQFLPICTHRVQLLKELVREASLWINHDDGATRVYKARVLHEADMKFTTTGDEFATLEITTDETVWTLDEITEYDLRQWVQHCDTVLNDMGKIRQARCVH